MGPSEIAIIMAGALAGGFVSGLAGFGTGITVMGIWLYAVPPQVAATLIVLCSVVGQVQTLPRIWHAIVPRQVLPFIIPGLIGVPLGTWLLTMLDPQPLKLGIGALLLAYAAFMGLRRGPLAITWGGSWADATVGFAGGVLGGLAGFSGVLLTVWALLRGWQKAASRGLFQAFNLSVLALALAAHAWAGLLTAEVGWAALAALPGTTGGAWLGAWAYGRLSETRFRQVVLVLLALSGAVLIGTNL